VPSAALAVRDVDFASPHTFSVAIYVFPSPRLASRFYVAAKHTLASDDSIRLFPKTRNEYGFRVVGSHVYFGFTSMDPTLCDSFGLCASFRNYGPQPSCGGGTCTGSGPPPLSNREFARVVSKGK
jgi:hypothetical protein